MMVHCAATTVNTQRATPSCEVQWTISVTTVIFSWISLLYKNYNLHMYHPVQWIISYCGKALLEKLKEKVKRKKYVNISLIHRFCNTYLFPIPNNGAGVHNRHENQWHNHRKHRQSHHTTKGIDQLKTTKSFRPVVWRGSVQRKCPVCCRHYIIHWRIKSYINTWASEPLAIQNS